MKKIFFLVVLVSALFSNNNFAENNISTSINENNVSSRIKDKKNLKFLIGTSFSYLYWYADNKVEDEEQNSYGSVNYDIGSSLYKGYYIQGKYNNKQLAISYIKNESEKKGGLEAKTSSFLFGFIDFDSFFEGNTLRFAVEKSQVNGIVRYNGVDINNEPVGTRPFTTDIERYSFLIIEDLTNNYLGIEYSHYKMPSLIGFSKAGDVKFVLFDPELSIKKVAFLLGDDTLTRIKNNHKDYNDFYIEPIVGVGFASIGLSNKSIARQKAQDLGYDGIDDSSLEWTLEYALNVGYIIQRRYEVTKGLGFSMQLGFKLKGTNIYAFTTSENDKEDDNELKLQFSRNDIWYGPYITLNLVF